MNICKQIKFLQAIKSGLYRCSVRYKQKGLQKGAPTSKPKEVPFFPRISRSFSAENSRIRFFKILLLFRNLFTLLFRTLFFYHERNTNGFATPTTFLFDIFREFSTENLREIRGRKSKSPSVLGSGGWTGPDVPVYLIRCYKESWQLSS